MPRMRTLKPTFFSNDQLAEVHPLGRLLFQGLWCMADREGRLEDRPKRIKAEVLPYDKISVEKLLDSLAERGFIVRYEANGSRFIQVVNFAKHQNPHVNEAASTIPAPYEHCAPTVPPLNGHGIAPSSHARVPGHGIPVQEQEQERESSASTVPRTNADPVPKPTASIKFADDEQTLIDAVGVALAPFGFRLEPRMWRKVLDENHHLDLEAEAYKQADWLRRNRVKTCSAARYTNWLAKAVPKVTAIGHIIDRTGVAN